MQVARSLIHELLSDECYQELDNDKPKHHLDVSSCISTFALLSVRKNNASVKVLATSFKRSCNRLQENFVSGLLRPIGLATDRSCSTAPPGTQDKVNDVIHTFTVFDLRKNRRSALPTQRPSALRKRPCSNGKLT